MQARTCIWPILIAAAILAVSAASSLGATTAERPSLSADRTGAASGGARWDELQETLRQSAVHSSAEFASTASSLVGFELNDPTSTATFDYCGNEVASGDLNADGRFDAVMGCYGNDDGGSATGSVVIYMRNAANTGYDTALEIDNPFPTASDDCAKSVATGDVNGDGRDDVIIGCPGNDDGASGAGSIIVFTRNAANTGFDAGVELDNNFPALDSCGNGVSAADVNADGRDDLLMGCSGNSDGAMSAGSVIIFTRNAGNTGFNTGVELDNPYPAVLDSCGTNVRGADVNADGRDDVLMSCPGNDDNGNGVGSTLIFTRNAANTGFDAGVEYDNDSGGSCGGEFLVGDLNGDGRDDFGTGCTSINSAGGVKLYYRNAANTGFDSAVTILNPHPDNVGATEDCGLSVDAGDANGDGRLDILAGCPQNPVNGSGSILVFPRNGTNTGYDTAIEIKNKQPNAVLDQCGNSVAFGDANGDGKEDAVAGCVVDSDTLLGEGSMIVYQNVLSVGEEIDNNFAAASDQCGRTVASGDLNGDGLSDLAMGCYQNADGGSAAGSVIVLTRNAGNTGFDTGVELDNPFPTAGDECGFSVAIGDVNGDGRSDVAVGCRSNDDGASNAGSVAVFTRNAANTGFDAGIELDNNFAAANDACGSSVAVADITGDDRADVAMGCSGNDDGATDAGSAIIFARNAANSGFDTGVEIDNNLAAGPDACGTSIAAGDINDDDRADLVLGCPMNSDGAGQAGSLLVFTRNAANTGFDTGVELDNNFPTLNDYCGWSVSLADVNDDGRLDPLLGCERSDDGATDAGSAIVFTRNVANTGFDTGVELDNSAPGDDRCGVSVAGGDVNGDGRDDVVLGCWYDDTGATNTGGAIVFTRDAANTGFDAGAPIANPYAAANDNCGAAVTVGDVTGDGRSDVAIGCPGNEDGAADAGSVLIATSTSIGEFNAAGDWGTGVELDNNFALSNDYCGPNETGDVNGDGRADVIVGCRGNDDGASDAGSAIVFTRNAANTGYDTGVELDNNFALASDLCGASVAAGDVNADGRDDVVMGCYNDDGATNAGSVIVFTRNGANTGFATGVELDNNFPLANDNCGEAVATGDVNGDGRDDILMGCYMNDDGATNAGSVIVFLRNAANTGFDTGVELDNNFPLANDYCGTGVAAGDLNGDGRDDVVLGCYGNDDVGTDAGSAIVFMRNAANTGFDTGVEIDNTTGAASDQCGMDVTTARLNADTRDDLIMGCPGSELAGGAFNTGSAVALTRNAANTGFDTGVRMAHEADVNNDACGESVRAGDMTGDGSVDVILGCAAISAGYSLAGAGGAIVFTRNSADSAYDRGTIVVNSTPAFNDKCGSSVAVGDVNADGVAEAMMGCDENDDGASNAGSVMILSYAPPQLTSRRLNRTSSSISEATFTWSTRAGSSGTHARASVDGGSSWEWVSNGAPHTFAAPGTDVRLRFSAQGSGSSSTVIHDLAVTYTTANAAPNIPALVSPGAGANTADTTPDLLATFSDADAANTGTVRFEVCTVAMSAGQTCAAAGGTTVASGASPAGIVNGANGTWTVSPALPPDATYHWHARNEDDSAVLSAWSASRALTIDSTSTISLDTASLNLGALAIGSNGFGTSTATVSTNDPDGYTVTATDESDTWGADCACGDQIPDWTGTNSTPSAWGAAVPGFMGVTVRDTTGTSNNRLGKWGAANASGWPETDVTNNLYAGLDSATSVVLHSTTTATAGSDTATLTWRISPSSAETAGAYDATVNILVVANP